MSRALLLLAFFAPLALASVEPTDIRSSWTSDAALRKSAGHFTAQLNEEDFARLAKGEIVSRILREPSGDRILGAVYTRAPLEAMWIAVHDVRHRGDDEDVVYRELPGSRGTHQYLYSIADAPWPLENRQTLVDVRFNGDLYGRTEGRVWERAWVTADPKLMTDPDPAALWLPVNEGSWQMMRVGEGTLAVLSLRVHAGGVVPDDVGLRWGLLTLDALIEGMVRFAERVPAHYGQDHAPVVRPDGSPIARDIFTAL